MTQTTELPRLYKHINQNGITYGPKKLALMRQACCLMEVPLIQDNVNTEGETISRLLRVKLFDPCSSWTWYIQEWDGEDYCYVWAEGLEKEWGYLTLTALSEIPGPLGIGIEIDTHFTPIEHNQLTTA